MYNNLIVLYSFSPETHYNSNAFYYFRYDHHLLLLLLLVLLLCGVGLIADSKTLVYYIIIYYLLSRTNAHTMLAFYVWDASQYIENYIRIASYALGFMLGQIKTRANHSFFFFFFLSSYVSQTHASQLRSLNNNCFLYFDVYCAIGYFSANLIDLHPTLVNRHIMQTCATNIDGLQDVKFEVGMSTGSKKIE